MLSNSAAERAVLAGICRYGLDSYVEVAPILEESAFTIDHNKVIFKCLKHQLENQNTVDFASLLSSANSLNLSDYVNRPEVLKHIRGIFETPINIDNVFPNAALIRRLDFARSLQNKCRDIYKKLGSVTGEETLSSILSIAENEINHLSLSFVKEEKTTPRVLGSKIKEYLLSRAENPSDIVGLTTPFTDWDYAIGGGLRRKCVDVIAARPKTGKSVFCDNVALHTAMKNIPVLVLDTEMSEEDHYNRIIANMSNIPINDIATGKYAKDESQFRRVMEAADTFEKLPYYYICINGKPFEETIAIIKRWVLKEVGYDSDSVMKDCLVIYDYLKLMSGSDISNDMKEYQILGFQITQLHNLAVEYDFPCLTFCQLNRDGISKESTDAVSGSDRIIWLCTSFSILKDKTEEEIATDGIKAGNRKLVPIVSRHGPGLENGYVCMHMDGALARFKHLGSVKKIGSNSGFEKRPKRSQDQDGDDLEDFD